MRLQQQGQFIQALEDRPMAAANVEWAWRAYVILDRSRQWGQGFPQPIQVSEMMAYATGRNLRPGAIDELIEIVQDLDSEYLQRLARRKAIGETVKAAKVSI